MIKVEIDGQTLTAESGDMVIEVADKAGIPIPRFCYHKKLSIAANCRMCLVEVEKCPKAVPACATPVADGMKVMTTSEKARSAQKSVMEFLLINHPLDCPICDQGGECELQDVSLVYGEDVSRYTQGKRSIKDKNIGPLISTDMTRCIHCTRCVRFGQEIAGLPELGSTGRGENTEIGTYIEHALQSEVSGNVIDLCPVGALTDKPYRFTARAWELRQFPAVSPHDCLGTNISVHARREQVMRVVPRECEDINETWISDRDRYSYIGVNSEERLLIPRIKRDGKWQTVDWLTALTAAVTGLGKVLERDGADQAAGVIHPNSTLEELYCFQKWLRALNVKNIDHRCQLQAPTPSQVVPVCELTPAELEQQQAILLIGSYLRKEQPLLALRVRKAVLHGAKVSVVNSLDYDFLFDIQHKCIVPPCDMLSELTAITKAAGGQCADAQVIAKQLSDNDASCILLGPSALNHPDAATLLALAQSLAKTTNSKLLTCPEGGNSVAAHLAGALPDRSVAGSSVKRTGLSTPELFAKACAAYVLFNVEPECDLAHANQALTALDDAKFVIQITPYVTPTLQSYADVLLPMAPFIETSGTYVNLNQTWQSVQAATTAKGEARPGWKILRVLANLCQLPGFDYTASTEIRDECEQAIKSAKPAAQTANAKTFAWPEKPAQALWRISSLAAYRVDGTVRRSKPLQQVAGSARPAIYLSPKTAAQYKVNNDDHVEVSQNHYQVMMQVVVDDRVPGTCAYIPAGFEQTNCDEPYGFVLVRAKNA